MQKQTDESESEREMETEETIEVRKKDGSWKPGSMGRYGYRLFIAQLLSDFLSWLVFTHGQITQICVCMCSVESDK